MESIWWSTGKNGRFVCEICPHACNLHPGKKGRCHSRIATGSGIEPIVPGGISSLHLDPMEKKPLYHFYPGSGILSLGTVGCNLSCVFCQNSEISQTGSITGLSRRITPEQVVKMVRETGAGGVAYTYNEPVISPELVGDIAAAVREAGYFNVVVSNGFLSPGIRERFFRDIDAANIDLKSIEDAFYRQYTGSRLEPVLETLEWLVRDSSVWTEVTNLIIPTLNDAPETISKMGKWILEHLGRSVPLHLSAFYPTYRLTDLPPTPATTLRDARRVLREMGLPFVYTGNILYPEGSRTECPYCGEVLIRREKGELEIRLRNGICPVCETPVPGRFPGKPLGTCGADPGGIL